MTCVEEMSLELLSIFTVSDFKKQTSKTKFDNVSHHKQKLHLIMTFVQLNNTKLASQALKKPPSQLISPHLAFANKKNAESIRDDGEPVPRWRLVPGFSIPSGTSQLESFLQPLVFLMLPS